MGKSSERSQKDEGGAPRKDKRVSLRQCLLLCEVSHLLTGTKNWWWLSKGRCSECRPGPGELRYSSPITDSTVTYKSLESS